MGCMAQVLIKSIIRPDGLLRWTGICENKLTTSTFLQGKGLLTVVIDRIENMFKISLLTNRTLSKMLHSID